MSFRKVTSDKDNGQLLSVTQNDTTPLSIGKKVLVIAGNQARIVPDYTVEPNAPTPDTLKPQSGRPQSGRPQDVANPGEAAKPDATLAQPSAPVPANPATAAGSKPDLPPSSIQPEPSKYPGSRS